MCQSSSLYLDTHSINFGKKEKRKARWHKFLPLFKFWLGNIFFPFIDDTLEFLFWRNTENLQQKPVNKLPILFPFKFFPTFSLYLGRDKHYVLLKPYEPCRWRTGYYSIVKQLVFLKLIISCLFTNSPSTFFVCDKILVYFNKLRK